MHTNSLSPSITSHRIASHRVPSHRITYYITLHYITLHYITLHYIALHYITLHYITFTFTLHYITLHYTTLHYITLHCITCATCIYIYIIDIYPRKFVRWKRQFRLSALKWHDELATVATVPCKYAVSILFSQRAIDLVTKQQNGLNHYGAVATALVMSPLLPIWYPSSCFNRSDHSLRPLRLSHQHKILPANPFQNLWTLWTVLLCPVLMVTLAKKKNALKKKSKLSSQMKTPISPISSQDGSPLAACW